MWICNKLFSETSANSAITVIEDESVGVMARAERQSVGSQTALIVPFIRFVYYYRLIAPFNCNLVISTSLVEQRNTQTTMGGMLSRLR